VHYYDKSTKFAGTAVDYGFAIPLLIERSDLGDKARYDAANNFRKRRDLKNSVDCFEEDVLQFLGKH
jgi:hypothetical protein